MKSLDVMTFAHLMRRVKRLTTFAVNNAKHNPDLAVIAMERADAARRELERRVQ